MVGVHQRFDSSAYRLITPYFAAGSFPRLRQIKHFEGLNGPDGIKAKSPGRHDPGHLYDPTTETGELLKLIETHYAALVQVLNQEDMVRAAFEAAWLAHYVCDGLTPAHHFPLDAQLAEHTPRHTTKPTHFKHPVFVRGETAADTLKHSWALWGGKGLLMTHFNFELGVATSLVGHRIQVQLDDSRLAEARTIGPLAYFKREARSVADLHMYESFCESSWDSELARLVRVRLAPQIVQTIAVIWLLAYLEAGFEAAKVSG